MTTRRLAVIMAADIVGFSAMMERDEDGTLTRVKAFRREVIEPRMGEHKGRVVKTMGDGFIAEFASASEAVRCGLAIQAHVAGTQDDNREPIRMRMGINLGEIIVEEDGDVFGDGVKIAARIATASS